MPVGEGTHEGEGNTNGGRVYRETKEGKEYHVPIQAIEKSVKCSCSEMETMEKAVLERGSYDRFRRGCLLKFGDVLGGVGKVKTLQTRMMEDVMLGAGWL